MVTLPDADSVGPLPDRLPRRMGVGSWSPDIISKDMGQLGSGLESAGQGLGLYAGQQQAKAQATANANAQSQYQVDYLNTNQAIANSTDPDEVDALKTEHQVMFDKAAATLTDPTARQKFITDNAPTLQKNLIGADSRISAINGDTALTSLDIEKRNTINAAINTDDDDQKAALWGINGAFAQKIDAAVTSGYITQQQAASYKRASAKEYLDTLKTGAIANGIATGDTSYLEKMLGATAPFSSSPVGAPEGSNFTPVNTSIPPEGRALLATIAGPESGGAYNIRYSPSGGTTFSGYADHPRIAETIPSGQPNAGKTSSAAGAYQMLGSTWDQEATKLGLKDFSPANQDIAAWDLAQTTYQEKTGRNLLSDLKSNNPQIVAGVAGALKGQWASLPGGVQPGTTTNKFVSQYQASLGQVAGTGTSGAPAQSAFVGLPPPAGAPFVPRPDLASSFGPDVTGAPAYTPVNAAGQPAPAVAAIDAAAGPGAGVGLSLVPPKESWPDGVTGVQPNRDGSLSYVNKDGTTTPVPGSKATGAPGLPAPQRPGGSLLDFYDPLEHAQASLEIQRAITQIKNANNQKETQRVAHVSTSLDAVTKQIVDGDPSITPDVMNQLGKAYADDSNVDVKFALAKTQTVFNTVQQYKSQLMTPTAIANDIAQKEGQYVQAITANPNDPINGLRKAQLDAAKGYYTKLTSDLSTDPILRATTDGVLPNSVNLDPTKPNFVANLQQRIADAKIVGDHYGITPPIIRPAEKEAMQKVYSAGGAPMYNLATSIVQGAPNQAGAIFKQLGADDKDGQVLAAVGNVAQYDPGAAKSIATGMALLKNEPRYGLMSKELQDNLGHSMSYNDFSNPATRDTVMNAANAQYATLSASEGNDTSQKFNQDRWTRAVNAVTGGVLDFRGNKVFSPQYGATQGQFLDAIQNLTDADFAGAMTRNGTPFPAAMIKTQTLGSSGNWRLESVGDGKYRVFSGDDRNRVYLGRDVLSGRELNAAEPNRQPGQMPGGPFILDLSKKIRPAQPTQPYMPPPMIQPNFGSPSPAYGYGGIGKDLTIPESALEFGDGGLIPLAKPGI